MNTKLQTAAQLIADNIREAETDDDDGSGAAMAREPYMWGLVMADVAKDVFALLVNKDRYLGREQWARNAMRAGLRSEHTF